MQTRHTVSVEGDEVVAVHHKADTDDWIIFSHGFLSDKTGSYEGRCERAVSEGYNAVRFDHRGCGESDLEFGEQTLTTRITDLHAVVEYFNPDSLVLFGSSFGGKVVFHAAVGDGGFGTVEKIEAVATRAPVTYTGAFEEYRRSGAMKEEFFDDFDGYRFETVENELDIPVAIFHGRDDSTVPLRDSFEAAEAFDTDVSVHAYADEGHNFSREKEAHIRDTLFDWLGNVTGDETDE